MSKKNSVRGNSNLPVMSQFLLYQNVYNIQYSARMGDRGFLTSSVSAFPIS